MDFSPNNYPFWGQSPLDCNQDFILGAKTAFSPSSVGSSPHSQIYFDNDPLDASQVNELDYDCFDTFNDVLLQDVKVDLFASGKGATCDLLPQYNLADMEVDLSGQASLFDSLIIGEESPLDVDSFLNPVESPPVQGYEQPQDLSADQYEPFQGLVYQTPVQAAPEKITIRLKKFKLNKPNKKRSAQAAVLLPKVELAPIVPDARMTLKEAINMEEADIILDRLFEQDSDDSEGYSTPGCTVPSSPDYSIASSASYFLPSATTQESPEGSESELEAPRGSRKRRVACSPGDRYLKKKEQNKRAALRYRNKKRHTEGSLQEMLSVEERLNKKLKADVKTMKTQVNILKRIMRQAFIAKGLVAKDAFDK